MMLSVQRRLTRLAQFITGDEAAEILVAKLRLGEYGKAHRLNGNLMRQPLRRTHALARIAYGNLGSNMRPRPRPLCSDVEAWRAVESVAIEQCHGGHIELGAARHQQLGQRCAFEKTEGGAGMEFDVHRAPQS